MILVPSKRGFMVGATASLLGENDHVQAWAEKLVRRDPDISWLLANYVEADEPNLNGHIFPLAELHAAQHTLAHKPLNMMHRAHYIVGAYAGAQLLTPEGVEIGAPDVAYAAAGIGHPFVEALAGMWHARFPEEFFNIRRAHQDGTLFCSMEVVPAEVSCPTCDLRVPYAGLESASYCAEMQGAVGPKRMHEPVFSGGAIIIPPVKPGWQRADVTAISKLISDSAIAESVYAELAAEAPHLEPAQWEQLMTMVLVEADRS